MAGHDPEKAPKPQKDGNWRLLVMHRDRIMSYTDTMPYGDPFPYPQAFGSGCNYAMTALRLGKSPEEAIAIAEGFDVYTGGPIQVVNIAEAIGLQAVKEAAE
jgi:ATP-dependent protease HslVU (ClpYQ) peptidase subunit